MPTEIKIPAKIEHHCEPCEHLKRENMICSRLYGISCDYTCNHPDVKWRMIGRRDSQPDWCPLRNQAPITHGVNCEKVPHHPQQTGWLHHADDDGPYDVDGVNYCGRCHHALL